MRADCKSASSCNEKYSVVVPEEQCRMKREAKQKRKYSSSDRRDNQGEGSQVRERDIRRNGSRKYKR